MEVVMMMMMMLGGEQGPKKLRMMSPGVLMQDMVKAEKKKALKIMTMM